jgi:hypothetical protein
MGSALSLISGVPKLYSVRRPIQDRPSFSVKAFKSLVSRHCPGWRRDWGFETLAQVSPGLSAPRSRSHCSVSALAVGIGVSRDIDVPSSLKVELEPDVVHRLSRMRCSDRGPISSSAIFDVLESAFGVYSWQRNRGRMLDMRFIPESVSVSSFRPCLPLSKRGTSQDTAGAYRLRII